MNFIKKLKTNDGFSLLELLIYIVLLGGVVVFVGSAFIDISGGSLKSEARYEVDSNLRHAMDRIRQDVKDATNITSPVISVKSDTLTIYIGPDKVTYDVYDNGDGVNILRRKFDPIDGAEVSQDITSDTVNIDSAVFRMFRNVDLSTNLVAISVNASITASYESNNVFSETVNKTILMEPFFSGIERGSFGSPGGGGGGGGGGGLPPLFQPPGGTIQCRAVYCQGGCNPLISVCL